MSELLGLKGTAVKGAVWRFSTIIFQAITSLITISILSRILSPKDFGVIAAISLITNILVMFSDFGIASALIQRKYLNDIHIQVGFIFTLFLGFIFYLLVWFSAPLFSILLKTTINVAIIRSLGLVFPIASIGITTEALLIRDLKFNKLFWSDSIPLVCGYSIVSILLALLGIGPWALVVASIVQASLKSVILLIMRPLRFKLIFKLKEFKELFSFGGMYSILRLVNYLSQNADNFIVGRWLGIQTLGFYDRAFQLMSIPGVYLGNVLDSVMFPVMSKIQNNPDLLKISYLRTIELVNFILMPSSVIFIILSPEIVNVLLGSAWVMLVIPLEILFFGLTFRTTVRICDSLARAKGALLQNTYRKIIFFLLIVISSLIGQNYGLIGVAIGVNIAIVINYLVMADFSMRLGGGNIIDFFHAMKPAILISFIVLLPSLPVSIALRTLTSSSLLIIIFVILSSFASFIVAIRIWPNIITDNMRWFLNQFIYNFQNKVISSSLLKIFIFLGLLLDDPRK
jgi:O-antigen/teichoic acid export membrane protein